jgi:hypothetical protein
MLQSVSDATPLFDSLPEGTIIVVPTEDSPGSFISLYRNQRKKLQKSDFQ